MFKMDLPVNPKEQQKIDLQRRRAEERKARIFDPKLRRMGIDRESMDQHVAEKEAAKRQERDFTERAAQELLRQEKIALMMDQRQQADLKAMRVAEAEYRKNHQKKHHGATWDLNDPHANRNAKPIRDGDTDASLGASSLQVFQGEDLLKGERTQVQRQQFRDWADTHKEFNRQVTDEEAHRSRMWELREKEQTQRALEMQQAHDSAYKASKQSHSDYNRSEMEARAEERRLQKAREEEDKLADIMAAVQSPMLSEDPSQHMPTNNLTKRKVVVDRYKGMSKEQLEAIRQEQLAQSEVARQRRLSDSDSMQAHDNHAMAVSRSAVLMERAHKREVKNQVLRVAEENAIMAQQQKAARQEMHSTLGRNSVDPSWHDQFQRDAR